MALGTSLNVGVMASSSMIDRNFGEKKHIYAIPLHQKYSVSNLIFFFSTKPRLTTANSEGAKYVAETDLYLHIFVTNGYEGWYHHTLQFDTFQI